MNLKHFGMDISASSGPCSEATLCEAFGAFLLGHAGLQLDAKVTVMVPDETFLFTHKGRVWRFSFILGCDPQSGRAVPFRIHFDFIKHEDEK